MRKIWLVDGRCWWLKIDGCCGGCCCWCWTAGMILYIRVFTKVKWFLEKVVVVDGSENLWYLDAKGRDLLMLQGKIILLGQRTILQLLEAIRLVRSLYCVGGFEGVESKIVRRRVVPMMLTFPFSCFFLNMVFAKAVRLYQCENELRAITILATNQFVVKKIRRRPLKSSRMRGCC